MRKVIREDSRALKNWRIWQRSVKSPFWNLNLARESGPWCVKKDATSAISAASRWPFSNVCRKGCYTHIVFPFSFFTKTKNICDEYSILCVAAEAVTAPLSDVWRCEFKTRIKNIHNNSPSLFNLIPFNSFTWQLGDLLITQQN